MKTTWLIFTKFDGNVAHEPWTEPLDFAGNPVTLHYGWTVGVGLWLPIDTEDDYAAFV